jgi:hypothetical protein
MFGFGNDLEMNEENKAKLIAIWTSLRRNARQHEDKRHTMERLQNLKNHSLPLAWEKIARSRH